MTRFVLLLTCVGALACDPRPAAEVPDADRITTGGRTTDAVSDSTWPLPGSSEIAIRKSRAVDFTGDGEAERVEVTARGSRYDSLTVALTIHGADGDTLWREEWPSLLYFQYDDITQHSDSSIARIVQAHVDTLLADSRFSMSGGLPAPLRLGSGSVEDMMREAARYHLAELDWRRRADLTPAEPTPPDAHSAIRASSVARERVDVVLAELRDRPTFMYFAGGEATYAIAWSEREQSFVRIFACC